MNDKSTSCTCGKFVISFMRIFMWPENVMSSSRTGIAALAKPFPRRTLKMIFGLTLVSFCFSVISEVSLGVNENHHSMRTTSSSVRGNVFTLSTRGAFVPRVKVLRRSDSRNGGQFCERIW